MWGSNNGKLWKAKLPSRSCAWTSKIHAIGIVWRSPKISTIGSNLGTKIGTANLVDLTISPASHSIVTTSCIKSSIPSSTKAWYDGFEEASDGWNPKGALGWGQREGANGWKSREGSSSLKSLGSWQRFWPNIPNWVQALNPDHWRKAKGPLEW